MIDFKTGIKRGNGNGTKILLLGVGLAMGLILVAKIYFEQSFDSFPTDSERVYIIIENYNYTDNGEPTRGGRTPGAIAPGIKRYSPSVEVATRCTYLAEDMIVQQLDNSGNANKGKYVAELAILADTSFFDMFDMNLEGGDAHELMQVSGNVMVSRSFANKMKNDVDNNGIIGSRIIFEKMNNTELVICGTFDDFPKNSSFSDVELVVSLPTIGKYMGDGSNNWAGNDRYMSFVRLHENADVRSVADDIQRMCDQNLPNEELEEAGIKLTFSLSSFKEYHVQDPNVQNMCRLLAILAIVVLLASVLNYVLISISAIVRRSKVVAVHKCYGASKFDIIEMIFSETIGNVAIALLVTIILLFSFQNVVEELLGSPLNALLSGNSLWILFGILLLVFIVCAVIPGISFAGIPVASAFKKFKEGNRKWKYFLLFFQFIASTFLIALLVVVFLQYRLMLGSDIGYSYENLCYVNIGGLSEERKETIRQEVAILPFVEAQTLASCLPFHDCSGNDISLPGDDKVYFNIADLYSVDDGYFELLEIPIVEGDNFDESNPSSKEVMVSKKFADKMSEIVGWNDGVVGKAIRVSEHSNDKDDIYTICGVYKDYLLGYIGNEEERPSIQFYGKNEADYYYKSMNYLLIKMNEVSRENLEEVSLLLKRIAPDYELYPYSYSVEMKGLYVDSRRFRDSVFVSGLIVLLITLIGLIGYSHDEISKRRSEIAIRKINGATIAELLRLFITNIFKIAGLAVAAGVAISFVIANRWLEQFSQKIPLHWGLFVASALITLLIIIAVVILTSYKAANANPVENLRNE